ncbi:MAG: hypothetical protein NZ772_05565 [Cyanobacteria bacterium]|nr:hypothetical protein [Cyanobacteriota bacterium]MDW8201059.1 hypothetical protein [Cyanobacteriota bacterium SKYGB_h_bin112]
MVTNSDNANVAPLSQEDWLVLSELFQSASQEAIAQIEPKSTLGKPASKKQPKHHGS